MTAHTAFTLINPQTKALAFKIFAFEDDSYFNQQKNYNYYSMVLVTKGKGRITANFSEYVFNEYSLISFSIYQPYMIRAEGEFKGLLINFHPDFFCIHKHHNEVACNGVLFNNIYESPQVQLTESEMGLFTGLVEQLKAEMQNTAVAQYELMIAYLKIFLINASRIKLNMQSLNMSSTEKEPFILKTLKDAVEEHFKSKHSPSDYADLLNISTKALNRISKTYFNKTLGNLIAERIIIEAKRELYLSSKPVKMIAYELGFNDEFYFSRFFKNNADVSPQIYRDTVGFARANA
ncbi:MULTISPECIES: helix-turn-helix domain-containing protein [unclassified Mucilaginibacter]|uniref:helix-turn-helix domain-containing protein n=1 Tax=unclassified Mucilaginibacter TaxID=2617802 RepID=UPI002AC8DB6C|nr:MULTISPECIES: helix-turn-helix domain-containing protein [unclassified Mucilaginibacter]MEB0261224.1 helix-turn-helix domain-containing protein [Mucilaginibacter sp. 10I4]MEB0280397.1 helix-turn-helix domain-containing protein [Mucilaginibacter sp. 10B2]MEB0300418.1 helix-turn-helix domain-containing protein [Mucilaginibacter sp. 5C4]WPX24512.1 helix-turn-helix domain-containing protein [Mucilaginibacter sp. 5C4]